MSRVIHCTIGVIVVLLGSMLLGSGATRAASLDEAAAKVDEIEILKKTVSDLYEKGEYAEAIAFELQSLHLREQKFGTNALQLTSSLNRLGQLYRRAGDYTNAQSTYSRSLKLQQRFLGQDHPDVAQTLIGLAKVSRDTTAGTQAI